MSEHALPEDWTRWPKDPFQLLGIARDVSSREVRRAYTRLIRQYKPEQFPEHFRRIREAYESALAQLEWMELEKRFGDSVSDGHGEMPAESEEPPEDKVPVSEDDHKRAPFSASLLNLTDELNQLWDQAIAGHEAEAYRRLVELSLPNPNDPEILIRLYWLLTVSPELDAGRTACDWLAQGLQARGLTGPMRELYRRELLENPTEAVSERCTRLLNGPLGPAQVAELAEWRWQALAALERWDIWAGDLERLRPRIIADDEDAWVRLLFSALDWLAWAPGDMSRDLFTSCQREIEQHEHLASRLSHLFDRLDFLLKIVEGWRALHQETQVPSRLSQVMALSWNRSAYELKPRVLLVLEEMCQEPKTWLWHLDEMNRLASGALAHFGSLLRDVESQLEEPKVRAPSTEAIAKLGEDFLDGLGMINYPELRSKLLDFCLREAIAPEKLAEAVNDRPAYWPPRGLSFAQKVTEDWPLRYLYLAHHIFWSL